MEETGYTIVDWLSAGLAISTIFIAFVGYLYFKTRLKIKSLIKKNEGLDNQIIERTKAYHELYLKYEEMQKEYNKLKDGHTIHEVRVLNAKPVSIKARLPLYNLERALVPEEIIADTKLELVRQLGMYCMEGGYVQFEEINNPMDFTTTLIAHMSVASNNEEIIKILRPDPWSAIDTDAVREINNTYHV